MKNALKMKSLNEETEVIIFYRDIRTYGLLEDYYGKAREKRVLFVRYEPERKPETELDGEKISLKFFDPVLNVWGTLKPDLVVLSAPVVPEGDNSLGQLLRLPMTSDGFFMEAHMKLRPIDFSTDGIFPVSYTHLRAHET